MTDTSPAPTPTVAITLERQIRFMEAFVVDGESIQGRMHHAILSTLRNAAANERDAARYRWWRTYWLKADPGSLGILNVPDDAQSFDAMVDAQLALGGKGE